MSNIWMESSRAWLAAGRAGYWRAVLSVVPWREVAIATGRRLRGRRRRARAFERASAVDATAAAEGLLTRPRLFPVEMVSARLHEAVFPGAAVELRRRAEAILRHEIELFGVTRARGERLDWHLDARTGRRFDPVLPAEDLDLAVAGADPRGAWELARGAHLLELGVAARVVPELATPARAEVVAEIESFLADNPLGRGVHWTSPLEVSLRALHWLSALELTAPDAHDLPPRFPRRLGGALVEHGRFIADHLEDWYLVPGNHLLANLLGLLAIGTAIGGAAEASRWRATSLESLAAEARRQVCADGAGFEGSTAYHRFSLEILLAADRLARAAHLPLDFGPVLGRMFRFAASHLGPDGDEPAFGDGDDGRVLPLCPRPPRQHDYLLPVGVVRCGDPSLRRAGVHFSTEALWLGGEAGHRAWRAMVPVDAAAHASSPDGGLHTLRTRRTQVTLRAGGHGQLGLGGHSHNDQLSIAVWLDGAPLVVDPGTYCYAADPLSRDHLRATAAHATLLVDGEEQSPLPDGRPFALPDRARGRLLLLDDRGDRARLVAHHTGYRRLPCHARHQREVLLDRASESLLVTDLVDGAGEATVEVRFPLGGEDVRLGVIPPLACLDGIGLQQEVSREAAVVWHDGRPWAALVPIGETPPPRLLTTFWSPRYGERRPATVVRFVRRATLPMVLGVAIVRLEAPTTP